MSRTVLSFWLAAFCCGIVGAAPHTKGAGKDPLYLPVGAGTKRVMEAKSGGSTEELVETVKGVEVRDGITVVTIERETVGRTLPQIVYGASEKGVVRLSDDGKPLDPPHWMLRLPVRHGEQWEVKIPASEGTPPHTLKYEMGGVEEIDVPAGKFQAVRVNRKSVRDGKVGSDLDLWFAPNVGLVRVKGRTGDTEHTEVLKSFDTPRK